MNSGRRSPPLRLVVRELRNTALDSEFAEDFALLTQEVHRCRDILRRLSSLASEPQTPFGQTSLTMLLEQVIAPYRQSPVQIEVEAEGEGEEPLAAHTPAILYGLGNFIENASDFARTKAIVGAKWTKDTVEICIVDDGPGFSNEVVDQNRRTLCHQSSKSSHERPPRAGVLVWACSLPRRCWNEPAPT